MEDGHRLGRLLRHLRLLAGFTQSELAQRAGISERTIRDLEHTRHSAPRRSTVELLARALERQGIDVQMLDDLLRARVGQVTPSGASSVPQELPSDIPDFTGRAELIRSLRPRLLDGHTGSHPTVVVISGKPGVGKTALAIHLAHHVKQSFPDGQLYVDLANVSGNPADIGSTLARIVLALEPASGAIPVALESRIGAFRTTLASRRVLMIVENAPNDAALRPLLPAGGRSAVLATSQRRLSTIEGATLVDLDVFQDDEAVALLGGIVGLHRVNAEPDDAQLIVEQCGRLPLAIRIAAARLAARPLWKLSRLAELLSDERARLDALHVGDLAVRAPLLASYSALAVPHQRAFRLLALLDCPDVTASIAGSMFDVPPRAAEEILERLVDANLIDDAETGYRFHDLIRLYGRELALTEEPEAVRTEALKRAFVSLLAKADQADRRLQRRFPRTIRSQVNLSAFERHEIEDPPVWFATELSRLLSAVRQTHDLGLDDLCWDLACTLDGFLELRHLHDLWDSVLQLALTSARRSGHRRAEAAVLRRKGEMLADRDEYAEALSCYDEATRVLDGLGDAIGEAHLARATGVSYSMLGSPSQAEKCFEQAWATFEELDDKVGLADVAYGLGAIHRLQGRWDAARACYRESLDAYHSLGEQLNEQHVLCALGSLEVNTGRHEQAREYLLRSIALARAIGHESGQAFALAFLGDSYTQQGRFGQAHRLLRYARAHCERLGERYGLALAERGLGKLALVSGDLSNASIHLEAALDVATSAGLTAVRARVLDDLGDVRIDDGDVAGAVDMWKAAWFYLEELGAPEATAVAAKLSRWS